MEVIRLSGYTEDEKTNIAIRYLLPKQIKNNGVKEGELEVTEAAIRDIVRYYTREAGVRSLEREMSKICRKVVKGLQLGKLSQGGGECRQPQRISGRAQVQLWPCRAANQVGQVVGLAWTEVGGDLLTIEAATMPGKGVITAPVRWAM
jgi:ATP-dependent Lon protease